MILISPFSFPSPLTQRAFAIGKYLSKKTNITLLVTGRILKRYFLDSVEIVELPFLFEKKEKSYWLRTLSWISSSFFKFISTFGRDDIFYTFKTLPLASFCGWVNRKIKGIRWISDWDDWEGKEGLGQFDPPLIRDFLDIYEKKVIRRADTITCCSKFMEKYLLRFRDEEDIFYIPNGVFLEDFKKIDKVNISHPSIFFGGSLGKVGELEYVIKSISLIREDFPNVRFYIAGVGNKMKIYILLTRKLGVEENVIFMGKIPKSKVHSFVRYSDVSVIPLKPSIQNFARSPVKIAEYMACGGCIISNPVGEAKYFLRKAGLLVDYSVEGFASGLKILLSDEKLRKKLKKTALKEARKFEWKKITKKFVSHFS